MSDNDHDGNAAMAGKWGCIGAVVVGISAFLFLLLMDELGGCAPDIPCGGSFFSHVLLPSVIISIATGLLLRWAIRGVRRKKR